MIDIGLLSQAWIEAKAAEAHAVEERRAIEDELSAAIGVELTNEGIITAKRDGYVIKATCRMNRKIDGDQLQTIAAEHGLSMHLQSLFRWKPELNVKEWKAATPEITGPLSEAITTTAGRPSFSITKEGE